MLHLDSLYPIVPFDPEMQREQLDWLVEGLWQAGKINGLAGAEKSGKSRLLNWILVGMAKGEALGLRTQRCPRTLYLCGEETISTVNHRVADYATLQGVNTSEFDISFIEAAAMRLDLKQQREWMLQKLLDEHYSLLVIDPFRRVHAANEDKSTEMAPILNDLRKWSNRHGLTIIFVHHTGGIGLDTDMTRMKSWFRGSSDIVAILDTAQYVDRIGKDHLKILRAGRFPPLAPLSIQDLGDSHGFRRSN